MARRLLRRGVHCRYRVGSSSFRKDSDRGCPCKEKEQASHEKPTGHTLCNFLYSSRNSLCRANYSRDWALAALRGTGCSHDLAE